MSRPLIRTCALATIGAGIIVMWGWLANVPAFKSVFPDAVEMKVNTALGLIGAGVALWMLHEPKPPFGRRAGQSIALLVLLLGLATLGQYVFGWQLGIDELLFADSAGRFNLFRGRMSPYSAASFASIGAAILLLPYHRLRPLSYGAAGITFLVGLVSAFGYAWNAAEITTDMLVSPVAVNTAVAFMFLGLGSMVATGRLATHHVGHPSRFPLTPVELRISLGFCGSFLPLAAGAGLTYNATSGFVETWKQLAHSHRVRATLSEVAGDLSSAGWIQRNYLLTGDPQTLLRYQASLSEIAHDSAALRQLLSSDAAQQKDIDVLALRVGQAVASLNAVNAAYQTAGFAAATALITDGSETLAVRAATAVVERMGAIENERATATEATSDRFQRLILASHAAADFVRDPLAAADTVLRQPTAATP